MTEHVKSILKNVSAFFKKKEKKKLILAAVLALAVVAAGVTGAVLLNRVQYTVLYSGLSAQEAGTVMNLLQELDVKAKAEGTDTILVPEEQADELRIELAAQGYPSTGLNYDIFSNSTEVGSTDLERQTYLQYQLQENMRTTICRMSRVKDCIVIVNLATSSSFVLSDNATEASVAVLLSLENNETLTNAEAKTIGAFVMKCVPKLKLENVSIVDSEMHYYDITSEGSGEQEDSDYPDAQKLTEQMKEILTQQALRVLEPAIGKDNVAVSVNLGLNFNKKTVTSVEFSPPVEGETEGLLRSSEEIYDAVNGASGAAGGEAGTDSNGVSAPEYVSGSDGGKDSESYTKTYNYELNEIQTQIEEAKGAIQNLSVAVLINSEIDGIDGYKNQIKNLVASAIGADAKYISVELMPFVQRAGKQGFEDYFEQNQKAVERLGRVSLIRTGIIAAAILLAVFMAIRLIPGRIAAAKAAAMPEEDGQTAAPGAQKADGAAKTEQERVLRELMSKQSDEAEKVEELMDKYPDAVVQTLRTWLVEEK